MIRGKRGKMNVSTLRIEEQGSGEHWTGKYKGEGELTSECQLAGRDKEELKY